jgi:hypothetical protein
VKIQDLDEGLWDGIKDLGNAAKSGYRAGRASSQGYSAAKGAWQATRTKQKPEKIKKNTAKKEKPIKKEKPTQQKFSSITQLPNGSSFVTPKGDTYVWNQIEQKWIGNQNVDPKAGLKLFNQSKQKFIPQ